MSLKLCEEKTTYNFDYQIPKLSRPKRYHEWTRVPVQPEWPRKLQPYAPKDVQTMRPWEDIRKIPFDLHWELKPIVRSQPMQTFEKTLRDEDALKSEVIKTRPRLYVSPAVSMDDITDEEIRNFLVRGMYTTVWKEANAQLKHKCQERDVPNTTLEQAANPVTSNYSIYKRLPLGWKEKGKEWETKQDTSLVNPTKLFWIKYKHTLNTPVGQDPFKQTIPVEIRQEIRDLIDKDELRFAYDKPIPGYAGYVSRNVSGSLRKHELEEKPKQIPLGFFL